MYSSGMNHVQRFNAWYYGKIMHVQKPNVSSDYVNSKIYQQENIVVI